MVVFPALIVIFAQLLDVNTTVVVPPELYDGVVQVAQLIGPVGVCAALTVAAPPVDPVVTSPDSAVKAPPPPPC